MIVNDTDDDRWSIDDDAAVGSSVSSQNVSCLSNAVTVCVMRTAGHSMVNCLSPSCHVDLVCARLSVPAISEENKRKKLLFRFGKINQC